MYILLEIHVTIIVDKYRKYPKPMILQSPILRHSGNQTVVCNADNLFILPPYLFNELSTRNALEISLQPEWQIDNSFFFKVTHTFSKIPKSWYTVRGPGLGF